MASAELYEAYKNGTFDIRSLEKALTDIRIGSYLFLDQAQKDIVGHARFDFKSSDLKLSTTMEKKQHSYPMRYVHTVDYSFIGENQRRTFKRSEFLNKEVTLFDCANNPTLFIRTYMVFVAGKFMDTVQIFCNEDKTTLVFDTASAKNPGGLPEDYLKKMIEDDVDITVYFIPNCAYGVYNTNRYVLQKYVNNLSLKRFNIANELGDETKYITFINTNDLLFSSVITETTNSADLWRSRVCRLLRAPVGGELGRAFRKGLG